jgi:hypothetical protein
VNVKLRDILGFTARLSRRCINTLYPPVTGARENPFPPKLTGFTGIIDAILEADKQVHVKQRHTAIRILERLRDEHGFTGGYAIIRNYINKAAIRQKEMSMPLVHLPGHAQVDFGEADGYIGSKLVRFHYFYLDMPHSDGCFLHSQHKVITRTKIPCLNDRRVARRLQLSGYLLCSFFIGAVITDKKIFNQSTFSHKTRAPLLTFVLKESLAYHKILRILHWA